MRRVQLCFTALFFCWMASSPVHSKAQLTPSTEDPFPLLPGLEHRVEFWKKIFTEYSTSQLVFFDPSDMSRIYEVLELGEENRSREYIASERERIAAAHGVDVEQVKAQRGIKERTAAGLKRANRYLAQMQEIFRERGLPIELTYLPLIESSYNITARSHAGALGMWQFMPATGRQYMRVTRTIDERRDPIDSTRAAAAFLKQAYDILGSWPLAITGYNFGPTGMSRAVTEVGSDNLVELIEKYNHPHWGYPPKNFYAEFLAAVDIGKNVDHYFPALDLDTPVSLKEVELKTNASLVALLKSSGLKRDEFLEWNPAVVRSIRVVPAGYRVKLPTDRQLAAIVKARQAPARSQAKVVRHRVRRGETILHLARRYGTSAESILKINGIRRAKLLRAGSTVIIPKL